MNFIKRLIRKRRWNAIVRDVRQVWECSKFDKSQDIVDAYRTYWIDQIRENDWQRMMNEYEELTYGIASKPWQKIIWPELFIRILAYESETTPKSEFVLRSAIDSAQAICMFMHLRTTHKDLAEVTEALSTAVDEANRLRGVMVATCPEYRMN